MRLWHSVSFRLTLTLLGITLGSLTGLSLVVDSTLQQFFIREAQANLQNQATILVNQASNQFDNTTLERSVNLIAQLEQVQVVIYNSQGSIRSQNQQISAGGTVEIPPNLIERTLAGIPQHGQFWVATHPQYPWWLYSTMPIRSVNARILGAVYVAMPLRRPKQFALQVKGIVMGVAIVAGIIAILAGLLLSDTLTSPLRKLQRQAQMLEAGDYTARSTLQGKDELALLGRLLDRMAAKLTETLAALQAQETARRELVANISHDLRTPLATLRVGLEAVLDGVVTGNKAQQYIKRACYETDRLTHLVEQLLLLAQVDAGQLQLNPQSVSIVAIAQECLFRMEPAAANTGIKLELSTSGSSPQVWVDPELTGQVVLNLLDNAIKYAPQSEVIYVLILPLVEGEDRNYVPLQVSDRGGGMEIEEATQASQRFWRGTSKKSQGGMGLGLAIADRICKLQGGYLEINSQRNRGTAVTLFLPTSAGMLPSS
ncbi:sensor histidine kinase [Aliterella atlantica]|uniref:histidine kinase n=1 Tax=Aliterella atlantica CENA595 TaxID=1618023 RepID=A0A0D8ZQ61_9CYAN|nr:HAMP domain-containing sensor histidine kinase [Aliterella atlantica]KJH70487.1 histidine kinase [Aliterella atlantica CENA595]